MYTVYTYVNMSNYTLEIYYNHFLSAFFWLFEREFLCITDLAILKLAL